MEKIITGKIYDTEADMAIAFYEVSSNTNNRYYYSERLHMTDDGEFYLHGTGGYFTHYAVVSEDGSKHPGEDIVLMSMEKARLWVTSRYGVDLIADHRLASMIKAMRMY